MHTLTARWIIPVSGQPIRDGVVHIDNDRIVAVEHGGAGQGTRNLGNVAVLPGLVNAHTHLELSGFEAPVGYPGISIVEWIGQVVATRRSDDYDPDTAVRRGLDESMAAGVAAIGDIIQATLTPSDNSITTTAFLELIGPTEPRAADALKAATEYIAAGQGRGGQRLGLSPHAPYTVRPELLEGACRLSFTNGIPVAFHLAESREEIELLQKATGPFRQLLQRLDSWDPVVQHAGRQPLDFLKTLARAERALVIHGNYLEDQEIRFIADRRDRMSVVYCPRTHQWFRHDPYPLEAMLAAGVNVALGTDSRASSPNLNLLEEMRTVARRHPDLPRDRIVEMGTIAGAEALGCDDELGTLGPGKQARLAVVQLPHDKLDDPYGWLTVM